jgi:hypothetical protein
MTNLIQDLTARYGVNMVEYLTLYKNGHSRDDMAEALGCSVPTVRLIATLLHLRLKRKFRDMDLANLERKIANNDSNPDADILEAQLDTAISQLTKAEKQAKKLNIENAVLRRKLEAKKAQEVKTERFDDFVERNAELLCQFINGPELVVLPLKAPERQFEGLCVCLADCHIGSVVKPEEVGDVNEFNYDVAKHRLGVLAHSVLDFPKQSEMVSIILGGDLIEGCIHGSIDTAEESFVESVLKASQMLYTFVKIMAENYKVVEVLAVTGNHGRIKENITFDKKFADYEYLVVKTIEQMLETNGVGNVEINFSKSGYFLHEINKTNLLIFHGDTQRSFNISNAKSLSELQTFCLSTFGKPFNHTISGHWHQAKTVSTAYGTSIQTGSLVGVNHYSFHSGFSPQKASQPIFFIEENGDIDFVQHVTLQ